ncbi:MAG: hypothetical protein IJB88_00605, partial [Clostridia bacterium]|nr:hypothetical protein [Clostridia bacterium]
MKKTYLSVLLLVFVLVLAATAGVVYAKYIRTFEQTVNVTVTADLAESVALYESQAVKKDDGSYSLNSESRVTQNTYTLLPGLDVPKDPTIEIVGKTNVPAYLYIEVVDKLNASIAYTLKSEWLDISVTGKNGGKVYVYAKDGVPVKLQSFDKLTIGILEDNKLIISDSLPRDTEVSLTFHAYMAQVDNDRAPKEVFE